MADPSFRGLVLGSPWRLGYAISQLNNRHEIVRNPERDLYVWQPWAVEALVRRSILYFDRVTIPSNPVLPHGGFLGADMLGAEGEIEFAHIPIQVNLDVEWVNHLRWLASNNIAMGGNAGKLAAGYGEFHRRVYLVKEQAEPGLWSYATVGEGIELETERTVRGYSVELYNSLPIPHETASYEDIIEFKRRERMALLDLRGALDEAYIRIASSADMEFVATREIAALKGSLNAVYGVMNTSTLPWKPQSISIDVKPSQLYSAATEGITIYHSLVHLGVPQSLAAAGGVLAGAAHQAVMAVRMKDFKSPAGRAGALKFVYKGGMGGIIDLAGPGNADARFVPLPAQA